MEKIKSVRGMNDLLPGRSDVWYRVERTIREVVNSYGYREIRTPLLERTELFKRSIGEQTDIVEKEMYTFDDISGDSLTLRPEATAACVRAGIEHGFLHNQQHRLWYLGPMFRRERPQKGRYRQFQQFGIEALGWPGPDIDAEIMMVGTRLWRRLGLSQLTLEINTLGDPQSRGSYREALQAYLGRYREDLDPDSQRRLDRNPLRILDSKAPQTQQLLEEAPDLLSFIDGKSKDDFSLLQAILSENGIKFKVNSKLVRGLDYYTGPVFEWTTDLLGAQSAVCAGGRYDGLVSQLGGQPVPAAGFACGVERLVEVYETSTDPVGSEQPDVWVCVIGDHSMSYALKNAEKLRDAGIETIINCGGGAVKRQLRRADQSGAQLVVVIGDDESMNGYVTVKSLREAGEQTQVNESDLADYVCTRLREEQK